MSGQPWNGSIGKLTPDVDRNIARMELASIKVCGWCGNRYEAWMDLDEWVCFACAMHPERLP